MSLIIDRKPCSCKKCDGKSIMVKTSISQGTETRSAKKRKSSSPTKESNQQNKIPKMTLLDSVTKSFEESILAKESQEDDPEAMSEDEGAAEVHDEFEPELNNASNNNESEKLSNKLINVNCGFCGATFENIEKLEVHLQKEHESKKDEKSPKNYPFVAKEGGWKCNLCKLVLRTSRDLKAHKSKKECAVLKEASLDEEMGQPKSTEANIRSAEKQKSSSPVIKNNFNALWQQSESRNWAAEFGYGKNDTEEGTKEIDRPKESVNEIRKQAIDSIKSIDIISAMREKFGADDGDESSDEDETYLYGTKTKDGRSQSMKNRSPRVLSHASRQTRKRLELLTKQAQALMKQKEKAKIKTKQVASQESSNSSIKPVEISSEEEDLNADINNEDDLLIPLANGWVCEKRRDSNLNEGYMTHYWSPEGENFKTIGDIESYVAENKLSLDMTAFEAADINVNKNKKSGGKNNASIFLNKTCFR